MVVKKLRDYSSQGEKEFMAEILIINQSRHLNLIELLGRCKEASKKQYRLCMS
jgi:hypothetical protein